MKWKWNGGECCKIHATCRSEQIPIELRHANTPDGGARWNENVQVPNSPPSHNIHAFFLDTLILIISYLLYRETQNLLLLLDSCSTLFVLLLLIPFLILFYLRTNQAPWDWGHVVTAQLNWQIGRNCPVHSFIAVEAKTKNCPDAWQLMLQRQTLERYCYEYESITMTISNHSVAWRWLPAGALQVL